MPDISALMEENDKDRSKRVAQRRLAFEVLCVVHGKKEAQAAELESQKIFGGRSAFVAYNAAKATSSSDEQEKPPAGDWNFAVNKYAPHVTSADRPGAKMTLPRSLVVNQPISRVLYAAKLVSSRSEGHRVVVERGAYVGSLPGQKGGMGDKLEFDRIVNWQPSETEKFIIDGSLLILRVGKWNVRLITIVSDEEFEKLGVEAPPGWEELKESQREGDDDEAEAVQEGEEGQEERPRKVGKWGSMSYMQTSTEMVKQEKKAKRKVKREEVPAKRGAAWGGSRWGP